MTWGSDENDMAVQLVVKPGKDFTTDQRKKFAELVLQDPQVNKAALPGLVGKAHFLAFLFIDGKLVGTNAIKNNQPYWQTLEGKAGVSLSNADYLGEVGYLHVDKDHRGARLGNLLVLGTLAAIKKQGLFATIQAKNASSLRLFERYGFAQVGKSWESEQQDDQVNLYVRQGS